jgi:predicted membrane channel-forming protein YqfA (hemolysin III family)
MNVEKKNKKILGFGVSIIYGIVLSGIGSLVAASFVTICFGGLGDDFGNFCSWLFLISFVPIGLSFALVGIKEVVSPFSNKAIWLIGILMTFIIIVLSGSIGAIIVEGIKRGGFESINIKGYLTWGLIYVLILLPFVSPVLVAAIKLLTYILRDILNRPRNNSIKEN